MSKIMRTCPECGGWVETDPARVNPPKVYTCSQCGVGLWLNACSLGYRLTVAQSGVKA